MGASRPMKAVPKAPGTPSPVLRVSGLGARVDGRTLFQNLRFDLQGGQTLVVLGPNGAGKTVLLRCLLGLFPHEGRVSWRQGVTLGYVPQRVPLNRELPMTVGDFFSLKGIGPGRARESLGQVGLGIEGFPDRQLGFLSSGQFQRVLIAWALSDNPSVLLFDEPTAGVDVEGEETLYTLLKRAQRDQALSILLVTHDLNIVNALATNVLCLNPKAFCYGPPRKVLDPAVLRDLYGGEVKYFRHGHG